MSTQDNRPHASSTETALSAALAAEADRITPNHRLEDIMTRSHAGSVGATRGHRGGWLVAAAAAGVIAVGAGVFAATRPQAPVMPGTATGTTQPSSAAPTSPAASSPAPSSPAVGALSSAALPIYFVGGEVGATGRQVLVREFQPSPGPLSLPDRVATAVQTALGTNKAAGYAAALPGLTAVTVGAVSADGIDVTLAVDASAGAPSRMATAAVVYTAQAAAGLGQAPVTLSVTRNGGTLPLPSSFTRMTRASFPANILASIWVDAPYDGQLVPSGTAVAVSGVASVFEASLAWEVVTAPAHGTPTTVASGHTMAAGGAPTRGAYSFRLPTLPDGSYEVVVRAYSAKDGSVTAERQVRVDVGIVPGG